MKETPSPLFVPVDFCDISEAFKIGLQNRCALVTPVFKLSPTGNGTGSIFFSAGSHTAIDKNHVLSMTKH